MARRRSRAVRARNLLGRLRPTRARLPYLVLALAMVVQVVIALKAAEGGWFGVDAVHYFTRRGPIDDLDEGLFSPYAGHWQPVLISVFLGLFAMFGMNIWPFVVFSLAVHLTVIVLTVVLLRRVGVDAWLAVLVGWLLLFFGAGAEVYISDAPVALSSAVMLGLGALLVSLRVDRWRRRDAVVVTVLLVLALMCSITGVVMVVVVGAHLAVRSWKIALVAVGPAALTFVVWFAVSGRTGARARGEAWQYLGVPSAVWRGLSVSLNSLVGFQGGGAVLLVLLVVVLLGFGTAPPQLRMVAWSGALGAATQMTLSAVANLSNGEVPIVGRYQYVMVVLLAPAMALLFTVARSALARSASASVPAVVPLIVVVAITAAATVSGMEALREAHYFNAAVGERYRSWVVGTAAAVEDGQEPVWTDIEDPFASGEDIIALTRPEVRDKVPVTDVTPERRLTAELQLFVGVRQGEGFGISAPALVSLSQGFATSRLAGSGCHTYVSNGQQPEMEVAVGSGVELEVTSASSQVTTELIRDNLSSGVRVWGLVPGEQVSIASTAKDALLVLRFSAAGTFEICTGG